MLTILRFTNLSASACFLPLRSYAHLHTQHHVASLLCSSKSTRLHDQQFIPYCVGQHSAPVTAKLSVPLSATVLSTATVAQAGLPSISTSTAARTSSGIAATDPWQFQGGQLPMDIGGPQLLSPWPNSSARLVDPVTEVIC